LAVVVLVVAAVAVLVDTSMSQMLILKQQHTQLLWVLVEQEAQPLLLERVVLLLALVTILVSVVGHLRKHNLMMETMAALVVAHTKHLLQVQELQGKATTDQEWLLVARLLLVAVAALALLGIVGQAPTMAALVVTVLPHQSPAQVLHGAVAVAVVGTVLVALVVPAAAALVVLQRLAETEQPTLAEAAVAGLLPVDLPTAAPA
jgi:hypothetical protein